MSRTILLVEDSEDDVFFMKRAMKLAGVLNPLQVTTDGQAAVDYISGAGPYSDRCAFPVPGLVLLDLRLPLVPGLDVLKCLRGQSIFRWVPVVVLTSSRQDSDVRDSYALGANSFLVKPADANDLVRMVKSLTEYWLQFNETPREHAFAGEPDRVPTD